MTGVDSSLASQCLAFCQALASKGKDFSFSLTIDSTFSFSLDTRESNVQSTLAKKRSSPSTQRRNAKRREEFLQKKLNFGSLSTSGSNSPADPSSASTPVAAATTTSYSYAAACNAPSPTSSLPPPSSTPTVKALRCSFKKCDSTFANIDEKQIHEKYMALWIGAGGVGSLKGIHSGPKRNAEEQGLD